MNINDAVILITGGTGSFGNAFVQQTLKKFHPRKLIIFSRDEMKQWEMAKTFGSDERIRFFLGDVRDYSRLKRAFDGVDIVIHDWNKDPVRIKDGVKVDKDFTYTSENNTWWMSKEELNKWIYENLG